MNDDNKDIDTAPPNYKPLFEGLAKDFMLVVEEAKKLGLTQEETAKYLEETRAQRMKKQEQRIAEL
jgi:hypothetical protein